MHTFPPSLLKTPHPIRHLSPSPQTVNVASTSRTAFSWQTFWQICDPELSPFWELGHNILYHDCILLVRSQQPSVFPLLWITSPKVHLFGLQTGIFFDLVGSMRVAHWCISMPSVNHVRHLIYPTPRLPPEICPFSVIFTRCNPQAGVVFWKFQTALV